jgi:hypothetical protein
MSFGDNQSDLFYDDRNCLHDEFCDSEQFSHRLQELEEEQEQLNSSLIALTSHFAQVQLRLKQIVDASSEEKEKLLKELEEFAFRGIPDTSLSVINDVQDGGRSSSSLQEHKGRNGNVIENGLSRDVSCKLDQQREKQKELMVKLKCQLEDLEKYAYETGDMNCIPSSMLIERQTVIIEQLKGKLALNLDDMDRLTPEQLRKQVDQALKDLINPVIMKEQLVEQLKTQVSDLERYIEYLQRSQENNGKKFLNPCSSKKYCKHSSSEEECTCNCPLHGNSQTGLQPYDEVIAGDRLKAQEGNSSHSNGSSREDREEAIKMIKRVMTLLQMITFAQFGCNRQGIKRFERNTLKKTARGSHWGDLRARLEVVIDKIIQINKEKFANDSDYTSDSGDEAVFSPANERMTVVVRKELAPALRDLIEHGLCVDDGSHSGSSLIVSTLFDWGCFSSRSSRVSSEDSFSSASSSSQRRNLTSWDLILRYYNLKVCINILRIRYNIPEYSTLFPEIVFLVKKKIFTNLVNLIFVILSAFQDGGNFSSAPARRLSQSFNLNIVGGSAVTPKQTLLTAILDVIETHTPFKRSPESHFKAFLSRGLNEGKLSSWLRLIMKSRTLVLDSYEPWSYTAVTG